MLGAASIDEMRAKTGYNPRQRKATAARLLVTVVVGFLRGHTLGFEELRAIFVVRFGSIRPRAFQLRFKSKAAADFFRAALSALLANVTAAAGLRLEGPLASFFDVRVYDATSIRMPPRARKVMPSTTKDQAGAKLLAGYSLKTGLLTECDIAAGTSAELPTWRKLVGSLTPNVLYLFDLAYFDRDLYEQARSTGAHLLLRLKTNARVWVTAHLAPSDMLPIPSWKLSTFLGQVSRRRGTTYDLDVTWMRSGKQALSLRAVGVSLGRDGVRWYLTTVPRERLSAEQIIQVYRLRWLIEFLFREWKQEADLGRCFTSDPNAMAALTYGALLGHSLVRSLRVAAALATQVPLEQLRPLASTRIVRALTEQLATALDSGTNTSWQTLIENVAPVLVAFARQRRTSRSRSRVSQLHGAVGA